jgi:protein-S-isoprenylcysteine O-methyltransferase Ste14
MKEIMETETIFRIILPLLLVLFVGHRGYYVKNFSKPEDATLKKRQNKVTQKVAGLLGMVGLISVAAFTIHPGWLAFANLSVPTWLRWTGVGMSLFGFILLQWAQVTLGKSWSDTPRMMQEQTLITSGPYRFIRHPIYTAFILILGSTLLISANWLIGFSWLGMTIIEVASRIGFEENLMIEYFGDEYREYMTRTGQMLPKVL